MIPAGWNRHAGLLRELVWRELAARYRGSVFGLAWALITPLFLLGVYALVFGEILKVRWQPGAASGTAEFAVILFAGLAVFNFFSESVSRAPGLMTGNVNYIKKVVFPVELLCVASVVAALVQMMMAVTILGVFEWLVLGKLPATFPLIIVFIMPVVLLNLGLSWFFASLGAYLRDIQQLVGIVVNGLIFLTPVFYPAELIPQKWRFLIDWNPLTAPINHARQVLVFGELPSIGDYGASLLLGLVVALAGYVWFGRTRAGLADVL